MRKAILIFAAVLLGASAGFGATGGGTVPNLDRNTRMSWGRLPVMGWNSWQANGPGVSHLLFTNTADNMNQVGLRAAGYTYLICDDGWQYSRDTFANVTFRNFSTTNGALDRTNTFLPELNAGNSWRPLSDWLHALGFKLGIYRETGVGTALTSSGCCPNTNAANYIFQDAIWDAAGGVDYLKLDGQVGYATDNIYDYGFVTAWSQAQLMVGRPVYLMTAFVAQNTNALPWRVGVQNSLRSVPKDIGTGATSAVDSFTNFLAQWRVVTTNIAFTQPGYRMDPDTISASGIVDTIRAMMTMYSLGSCDLILQEGAVNQIDTPVAPTTQFPLNKVAYYTNADAIAIDQDALQAAPTYITNQNGLESWQKRLANGDTALAILDNNTNANGKTIAVTWTQIGKSNWCKVFDCWNKSTAYCLGGFTFTSVSNMTADMYRITQLTNFTAPAAALTFLNAASLTTQKDTNSIVSLTCNAITNGWWTNADIIYPFTGTSAGNNSLNLKDTTAFVITWSGTLTHNANGVAGNGSTGYGDTGYIPDTSAVNLSLNNTMYWAYSGTASPTSGGTVMGSEGNNAKTAWDVNSGIHYEGVNRFANGTDNSHSNGEFTGGMGVFVTNSVDGTRVIGRSGIGNSLGGAPSALPDTASVTIGAKNVVGTKGQFSNCNLRGAYIGAFPGCGYAQFLTDWKQYQRLRGRCVQEDF